MKKTSLYVIKNEDGEYWCDEKEWVKKLYSATLFTTKKEARLEKGETLVCVEIKEIK